jgi:hypothetical protein
MTIMNTRRMAMVALMLVSGAAGSDLIAPRKNFVRSTGLNVWIKYDTKTKTQWYFVEPEFTTDADTIGIIIETPTKPTPVDVPAEFFTGLMHISKLHPTPSEVARQGHRLDGTDSFHVDAAVDQSKSLKRTKIVSRRVIRSSDRAAFDNWLTGTKLAIDRDKQPDVRSEGESSYWTLIEVNTNDLPSGQDASHHGAAVVGLKFTTPAPILTRCALGGATPPPAIGKVFLHAPIKLDFEEPYAATPNWVKLLRRAQKTYVLKAHPFPKELQDTVAASYAEDEKGPRKYRPNPVRGRVQLAFGQRMNKKIIEGLRAGRASSHIKAAGEHLKEAWYLTVLAVDWSAIARGSDIKLVPAMIGEKEDRSEHTFIVPGEKPLIRR